MRIIKNHFIISDGTEKSLESSHSIMLTPFQTIPTEDISLLYYGATLHLVRLIEK